MCTCVLKLLVQFTVFSVSSAVVQASDTELRCRVYSTHHEDTAPTTKSGSESKVGLQQRTSR